MKQLAILALFAWACSQAPKEDKDITAEPIIATQKAPDLATIVQTGKNIAQESQQALGGQLKASMARGGLSEAIHFCNINAIPLTDSLAQHFGVIISRVTDRPRNSINALSPADAEVFSQMQTAIDLGNEAAPITRASGDGVAVYIPIKMQAFCLTCHGKEKEGLLPEAASLIAETYPQDKATGYTDGDLRGMWRVIFSENITE